MTFRDLSFAYPMYYKSQTTPTGSQVTMNAAGEKWGYVLQAPKAGNIRKIHFLLNVLTTPTDADCRIETVDLSTGQPSGTLWATNTNVTIPSASFAVGTVSSPALTADAAVDQGDVFAVVIVPTGTPNYEVLSRIQQSPTADHFPYQVDDTGTGWARGGWPIVAVEYSDGSFAKMPGVFALGQGNITGHTINTGTNPDEIALKFQLPWAARLVGCWYAADHDSDHDIVLYDEDGSTALETLAWDGDVDPTAFASGPYIRLFDTAVELAKDHVYYLVLKPTTGTSSTFYSFRVSASAWWEAFDGDATMHWSQRLNAGAWSDTALRRPFLGLLIDGVEGPQVVKPDAVGSAGDWTAQPGGTLDGVTSDDDDATRAQLIAASSPSTMTLSLEPLDEPEAGDWKLRIRRRSV